MLLFWIFGGLWTCSFILAIKTLILSSITSIWYFGKRDDDSHNSVITSIYRTFRFHLGSLAFGSLLLAIVNKILEVYSFVSKKKIKNYFFFFTFLNLFFFFKIRFFRIFLVLMEKYSTIAPKNNKFFEFTLRCLSCCLVKNKKNLC
jgi:hypothetical protein